jgi:hypothetical protein
MKAIDVAKKRVARIKTCLATNTSFGISSLLGSYSVYRRPKADSSKKQKNKEKTQ